MSGHHRAVLFMLVSGAAFAAMGAFVRAAADVPVLEKVVVLAPFIAGSFHIPTVREAWLLLGIGIGAAIGQFGLTLAYRYAPAAGVSIYSYMTIVFSALLVLAIWGEVPDRLSLIGGALILAGGTLAFLAERRT